MGVNCINKLLVVILSLCFSSLCFADGTKALSLQDLVEHALKNSPTYLNAVNNLAISKLNNKNSAAAFLPSLDLETVQGYQSGDPVEPVDNWPGRLQLALGATLYNNGSNFINYKQSKLGVERSRIELEQAKAQICLEISNEYYNYQLATKLLEVQEAQYSLLQKQFRSVEEMYQNGYKKRIDFVRFKTRLRRANLSRKQSNIVKEKSLIELKRILAWKNSPLNIKADSSFNFENKLKEASTDTVAIQNHYIYKTAAFSKEINQLGVGFERRKYWPEVFVNTGLNYQNNDYLSGLDSFEDNKQLDWFALLTFRYNLWDWRIRRRNLKSSKLTAGVLNNSIESDLLSLRARIDRLKIDIIQQGENYFLNKELVELERGNFSFINNSYKSGKTTFLDLIGALDNYTSAQESYYNNLYLLKKSISEHYFNKGDLYEKIKTG